MHMCLTGQTVVKPRHLFVHKIPELDVVGDTLSTLKFAEWVAIVELGAAQANKESSNVSNLKEQIVNIFGTERRRTRKRHVRRKPTAETSNIEDLNGLSNALSSATNLGFSVASLG
ncbi:uncharacterized protein LOC143623121 isoform X1 [Bidens hawaiensis]|uniref:uncharacterized protein LOC143623121 isoform X1 n=1 Tax=Bidens hawaiensis TaxID=980011 RepID=UPI0040497DBC